MKLSTASTDYIPSIVYGFSLGKNFASKGIEGHNHDWLSDWPEIYIFKKTGLKYRQNHVLYTAEQFNEITCKIVVAEGVQIGLLPFDDSLKKEALVFVNNSIVREDGFHHEASKEWDQNIHDFCETMEVPHQKPGWHFSVMTLMDPLIDQTFSIFRGRNSYGGAILGYGSEYKSKSCCSVNGPPHLKEEYSVATATLNNEPHILFAHDSVVYARYNSVKLENGLCVNPSWDKNLKNFADKARFEIQKPSWKLIPCSLMEYETQLKKGMRWVYL